MADYDSDRPLDSIPDMDHEAVQLHAGELRVRFPHYTAEQALAEAVKTYHESASVAGVQVGIPLDADVIAEIRDHPEGFFR